MTEQSRTAVLLCLERSADAVVDALRLSEVEEAKVKRVTPYPELSDLYGRILDVACGLADRLKAEVTG